ncbi:TadE family protein [Streptomyces sp. NPDC058657]|uniref:TadE family protein n=1 Tax=unclassified Streptomyces TaxID=2593676 RepID=UPI0036624689
MRGRDGDKGVAALEFAGFLPLLLLVAMAAIQLGIIGYAASQASSGARAAARVESQEATEGQCEAAGLAAMSGWVAGRTQIDCTGGDIVKATATLSVPAVIPAFTVTTITRSASMPSDDTP